MGGAVAVVVLPSGPVRQLLGSAGIGNDSRVFGLDAGRLPQAIRGDGSRPRMVLIIGNHRLSPFGVRK